MRLHPNDEVMSDVVRRRLAALADELGPAPVVGDAVTADPAPVEVPGPTRAIVDAPPHRLLERGLAFGREHLVAVAIIALAGVAWALFSMTQARTLPVAVAAPTPVEAAPSPTPSPTPRLIQVHVLGAVAKPGVVRVPDGARVHEALKAAGGLTSKARPGELNLAAPVSDGAQIVIGSTGDPGGRVQPADAGAAASPGGSTGGLDLNTATAEQLDTLPGVGPVTAASIIAWRTEHERFTAVSELQEVDGIGPKTYAQLEPLVKV